MILYITIIIGIILDLYTKFLAKINQDYNLNLLGDLLYFKYSENVGVAFSFPITGIILKILTTLLIIGIFFYYFKFEKIKKNKLIDFSFGLILAGALANAFGRIFDSKVIDFIGVKYFAIFNLADAFITIGIIIYILLNYKK